MKNIKSENLKSVAFVVWFFPKLSETFVLNQILSFKKRGIKVYIFAVKDPRKELAKEDIKPEKIVHKVIEQNNLFDDVKYGNPKVLRGLIKEKIQNQKLDIVYFQFPDLASKILGSKNFDIPTVTVFHDIPKKNTKGLVEEYKDAFEKSDVIFAISDFTRKELINLGCPMDKILVHHMGVDTKLFKPKERKRKSFNFLIMGRMVEKKGFKYGIEAFGELVKEYPNTPLALNLVGDGILYNELQFLVKKLGLEKVVNFYGKLPQEKVIKILQSTSVILIPSVTAIDGDREGLPVSILEAASCGIPIIATRHAAIPEVVERGIGLLVNEKSVVQLKDVMLRLLQDGQFGTRLGNKGRLIIKKDFNIEKQVDKLADLFAGFSSFKEYKKEFDSFTKVLSREFKKEIFSVMVVGSLSRQEPISESSDIDLLIVFNSTRDSLAEDIFRVRQYIKNLEKSIGINITPQIFNKHDLFQLLAPSLYFTYSIDGKVLFGADLKKIFKRKISELSGFKLEVSILKRVLFDCYFVRQAYTISLKDDLPKTAYLLAKYTFFISCYYLYIDKKLYITSKIDLIKYWKQYYTDQTPLMALKIINNQLRVSNQNILNMMICIENTVENIRKILEKRYGKEKVYIDPF